MEVTNKGYINFNNEYNKHTQDYTTASMSFANGKNEDGSYKHGYIRVIAYGELGNVLYDNVGNMVTIKGRFRQSEYEGKKYSQIRIDAINGYAPAKNQNNGNFGQNQGYQNQGNFQNNGSFGNQQPQNAINGYQNPNQGNFGQPQGQQTSFFQGQSTQTNPDFSRNFGNANPMDINEEDLPF
ncbi:TPA: hypothetical protein TUM69_000645 [Streptococcus equi subsp. zooepidemicus]|nr:hypothetical protein [Streptococcus equi subsp. zooepidemicus]HEL0428319.1 hypothetical protein [Streptococcus equi subsp. zooepidemicus]HEL0430470.1 hypothetical protein [Streptococcus equi subsp. zooepidemicus]HEL0438561.1 hypothetical protein [Streptococcus equi subsp. zooepidemicus]